MLVARKSHCNGRNAPAIQRTRSLNHGRVALLRDRFVQSGVMYGKRMYSRPAISSSVAAVYGRRLESSYDRVSAGIEASYPLPTGSALTESPERADDSSPGSASLRAQPWVKFHIISAANPEAARSAKFICGYIIRPIRHIRPIAPHPKSIVGCEPLIKIENGLRPPLSPTSYKPIISPENKGIKPKSNRHKPKKGYLLPLPMVAVTPSPLCKDWPQRRCLQFALIREIRVKISVPLRLYGKKLCATMKQPALSLRIPGKAANQT